MMLRIILALAMLVLGGASASAAPGAFASDSAYNGTLSNSNRKFTSTTGDGSGNKGVLFETFQTSGKYYFEAQMNLTNDNSGVGFGTYAGCTGSYMGSDNYAIGFFKYGSGSIYYGASQAKSGIGTNDTSAVWRFAVDYDNKRFWVAKAAGNWNNDGSADPATNTGGVSFNSATWTGMWFMLCMQDVGEWFEGNWGQAAFTYSVPSGFSSGMNAASAPLPDTTNFPSLTATPRTSFAPMGGFYTVSKFTLPARKTLDKMEFSLQGGASAATSVKFYGVVYADNGTGSPTQPTGSALCRSAQNTALYNGLNTATFTGCTLNAGTYWLGFALSATGTVNGRRNTQFNSQNWSVSTSDASVEPTWPGSSNGYEVAFLAYLSDPPGSGPRGRLLLGANDNFPRVIVERDRCRWAA